MVSAACNTCVVPAALFLADTDPPRLVDRFCTRFSCLLNRLPLGQIAVPPHALAAHDVLSPSVACWRCGTLAPEECFPGKRFRL